MSYYTGSATDFAALKSAVEAALTTEGWTLSTGILSKGVLYAQLTATSTALKLGGGTGASSSALTGGPGYVVQIGASWRNGTTSPMPMPVTYHLFVFELEVYLVVNYNVVEYQYLAWGKSTVSGLLGTGMWFSGSISQTVGGGNTSYEWQISTTAGGEGGTGIEAGAIFWQTTIYNIVSSAADWVNHGLDARGWSLKLSDSSSDNPLGIKTLTNLITLLPNAWNSEAVLLPIRAYLPRASSKCSLVADLEYARYTRIDNYDPGQIIGIGDESWMVFPWLKKDAANRNGGSIPGTASGSLGWAIRYEGD